MPQALNYNVKTDIARYRIGLLTKALNVNSYRSLRVFSHRDSLRIEPLESRRLLAGDWQNQELRCDVDASGLVLPVDSLIVLNALNTRGTLAFEPGERQEQDPYLDVSGDQRITSIDALMVLNALHRASAEIPIAMGTDSAGDPNGNNVVGIDSIELSGQTSAYAKVVLTDHNDVPLIGNQWTQMVDAAGDFEFDIPLDVGLNELRLQIIDELGRTISVTQEIRRGDVVTDWNAAAMNVVRDWTIVSGDPETGTVATARPPEVARNLAMIHAAMFDAANAVGNQYESYAYDGPQVSDASEVAAVATAAHSVASTLYGDADELAVWDATLSESLSTIPDDAARVKGIELGNAVAQQILTLRENDRADAAGDYTPGDGPGSWQPTYPNFSSPALPQWPDVEPFAIPNAEAFRVDAAPLLTSQEYALALDEVMRQGELNSAERTADQTEIALFWADGGGTATPPGHWNRIAADVVLAEGLTLVDSARAFALLNIALADAGIVSWDAKYAYDLWRPIDAIQQADTDGNSETFADPDWLPLLATPPFPTYTSGHSTFSGAAAAVLTSLFGDDYAFQTSGDNRSGLTRYAESGPSIVSRSFNSFHQAADEAGVSRIYGGIHFAFDNTQGLLAGREVGEFVVSAEAKLRP